MTQKKSGAQTITGGDLPNNSMNIPLQALR